eukprot:m.25601 g.25601  ORF g.25601 m.25601 type:complete len:538 (+) comp4188_c0_seq1:44-1657(+)
MRVHETIGRHDADAGNSLHPHLLFLRCSNQLPAEAYSSASSALRASHSPLMASQRSQSSASVACSSSASSRAICSASSVRSFSSRSSSARAAAATSSSDTAGPAAGSSLSSSAPSCAGVDPMSSLPPACEFDRCCASSAAWASSAASSSMYAGGEHTFGSGSAPTAGESPSPSASSEAGSSGPSSSESREASGLPAGALLRSRRDRPSPRSTSDGAAGTGRPCLQQTSSMVSMQHSVSAVTIAWMAALFLAVDCATRRRSSRVFCSSSMSSMSRVFSRESWSACSSACLSFRASSSFSFSAADAVTVSSSSRSDVSRAASVFISSDVRAASLKFRAATNVCFALCSSGVRCAIASSEALSVRARACSPATVDASCWTLSLSDAACCDSTSSAMRSASGRRFRAATSGANWPRSLMNASSAATEVLISLDRCWDDEINCLTRSTASSMDESLSVADLFVSSRWRCAFCTVASSPSSLARRCSRAARSLSTARDSSARSSWACRMRSSCSQMPSDSTLSCARISCSCFSRAAIFVRSCS